ncbi:MAG: patatin-like phospholipase family protein [Pseudomonadota bacterium]
MTDVPDLFTLIGAGGRQVLADAARTIEVPAGRTLFSEGDVARSLFFIRNGALGVFVRDATPTDSPDDVPPLLIYVCRAGETVGEMGVISGAPRSASVIAIRDTELWVLSRTRFNALLKSHPQLMATVMRLLTHRLHRLTREDRQVVEPCTIALVPTTSEIDIATLGQVARRLRASITACGARAHVIAKQSNAHTPEWFAAREKRHDVILLVSDPETPEWHDVCARQADRILFVSDKATAHPDAIAPSLRNMQRGAHQLCDLVVLHRKDGDASPGSDFAPPSNISEVCSSLGARRLFHLRERIDSDWARLARILCGRANGLVLSGGAARGFAHIGVLRAMEEAGIPVDFVGGTSMGAIVAACVALEMPADEIAERVREIFVRNNPMTDYVVPFVGLLRGAKADRLLREKFGAVKIEDMWRPFYAVSSNLTKGGPHIHRDGPLTEALRASTSLPGIFPPVPTPDGLLVDGAATSNLPVATMRALHRGRIIAVDVARDLAITPQALAAESEGPWRSRLRRPPILSILMRAATISSEETDRREARLADLLITPPLGDIELRDWQAFDRAVDAGYRHACKVLASESETFSGRIATPAIPGTAAE